MTIAQLGIDPGAPQSKYLVPTDYSSTAPYSRQEGRISGPGLEANWNLDEMLRLRAVHRDPGRTVLRPQRLCTARLKLFLVPRLHPQPTGLTRIPHTTPPESQSVHFFLSPSFSLSTGYSTPRLLRDSSLVFFKFSESSIELSLALKPKRTSFRLVLIYSLAQAPLAGLVLFWRLAPVCFFDKGKT